jgi:hypothetical protein
MFESIIHEHSFVVKSWIVQVLHRFPWKREIAFLSGQALSGQALSGQALSRCSGQASLANCTRSQ